MAAAPSGPLPPSVSYTPQSDELSYYEGLFSFADTAKSGQLDGREAVTFLSRSKLSIDILKYIWNITDQNPKTNTLDKKKFFAAVRLIQLYQHQSQVQIPTDGDLSHVVLNGENRLRPPYFEGVPPSTTSMGLSTPNSPTANSVSGVAMSTPNRGSMASSIAPIPQLSPMGLQQSQQQQAPPTPNTLATQDPYTMSPAEKARYDALFPQYQKGDGFVYGQEAVALFMKSGLDQGTLRAIWNMVDHPVDNKLSQLEFAIAMHLIVCVSKKNLPMPSVFPPSLKGLKDQESSKMNGANATSSNLPASSVATAPLSPPHMKTYLQPSQFGSSAGIGGMSISDAFDDIPGIANDASHVSGSDTTPVLADQQVDHQPISPQPAVIHIQSPAREGAMMPPSPQGHMLPTRRPGPASVSSNEELKNLQSVLQKLQAENVSLKAQLGQFSDEEASVRQEITQTISEISALSMELTTLRSQVTVAKSSLIDATSELRAQIEKRDALKTLIEETEALKATIEFGKFRVQEIQHIAKTKQTSQQQSKSETSTSIDPPTAYEHDLFSYDKPNAVYTDDFKQSHTSASTPQRQETPQYDNFITSATIQTPQIHETTLDHQNNQAGPSSYQHYHSQQQNEPDPTVEAMQRLEQLKYNAAKAEREATSAQDHARALAIQYEDLRMQAERAEITANEKKPKKKGIFKGGKKEARKESEQAQQDANMKINQAQHAHLEMRQAEDYANRLIQHAKYQKQLSDDYAIEVAKIASVQSQKRQEHNNIGYGDFTTIDLSDQMSKASEVSFGNSRASAMGYSGFPGTTSEIGDDASGLMGGSTGYGDGIMGSYHSSNVGFTDNSVYGGSVQGNNSVSGSISSNNLQGGSVSHVQYNGYVIDAASQSAASDMFYQNGNNNSGSQVGYNSDTASRSIASDMNYPSGDKLGMITPILEQVENDFSGQIATASNDTEQMNNVTEKNSSIHAEAEENHEFGSYTMKDNTQSLGFHGIPTPDKEIQGNLASSLPESDEQDHISGDMQHLTMAETTTGTEQSLMGQKNGIYEIKQSPDRRSDPFGLIPSPNNDVNGGASGGSIDATGISSNGNYATPQNDIHIDTNTSEVVPSMNMTMDQSAEHFGLGVMSMSNDSGIPSPESI